MTHATALHPSSLALPSSSSAREANDARDGALPSLEKPVLVARVGGRRANSRGVVRGRLLALARAEALDVGAQLVRARGVVVGEARAGGGLGLGREKRHKTYIRFVSPAVCPL